MDLTLNQVAMMTGLNTRTLRNYIRDGFLQGDKSSGKWMFSFQQYNEFVDHPFVKPALKSKRYSALLEAIRQEPGAGNWISVILNLGRDPQKAKDILMRNLKDIDYPDEGMLFQVEPIDDQAVQIVIAGPEDFVFGCLDKYREAKKTWEDVRNG